MATNIQTGLTSAEAARSQKNISAHHESTFELALKVAKNQVTSFFFILLIISGVLSILLKENIDAVIFFSIAGINAILGFWQEFRANRSAQLLEKMVDHMVTVRRDGKLVKIPHTEVVLGDIILLNAGDVLVVDAKVVANADAFLDESVITGESLPRQIAAGEIISAGATVSSGSLVAEVAAVGKENSLIQYAEKISKLAKQSSFEQFTRTIVKSIMVVTVACLLLVLVVNVLIVHGMPLPEYILFSIAMMVGVVPESLPLIITLILTNEAIRLSKHRVLIKKLSALQNLGNMNYFFTDKTGTITENRLNVKEVVAVHDNMIESMQAITGSMYERTPMDEVFDNATAVYLEKQGVGSVAKAKTEKQVEAVYSAYQTERGYATYTMPDGTMYLRGQYNSVAAVCHTDHKSFETVCEEKESQGLRVIAVAVKPAQGEKAVLQGAVVFEDPLKPDAVKMYRALESSGVSVKIITGDSVPVANYIGAILDPKFNTQATYDMSGVQSREPQQLTNYSIYARSKPDQKSMLIEEHSRAGVIGFLGEGVNDALALKRADIGFVVSNASDVARQAADVILLEKSLQAIVSAIDLSREAFIKVRTYLLCTLTGNIGTLFSLSTIMLFYQIIPMLPIQILLNNLLTDLPLMFIIADRVIRQDIRTPIKNGTKAFFTTVVLFAAISSLFDFVFFSLFHHYDISVLRTGWFVSSVLAELILVFSLRSHLSVFQAPAVSLKLGLAIAACFGIAIALPYVGFGKIFDFVPLSGAQISIILLLTLTYLVVNEIVKKILVRR